MNRLSLLLAICVSSAHGAELVVSNVGPENGFAKAALPSAGAAAPLGFYSAGCIKGARALRLDDESLVVMKPSRKRYFGHPELLALLDKAKAEAPRSGPILVGDLSQPRGGPMPIGHASHQVGLDADIWFTPESVRRAGAVKAGERESLSLETVLDESRRAVNEKRWPKEFAEQILWFAGQPGVQRIFVHGAIKKQLCASHRGHPFLAKVRPWYFHDSHFHVRMRCPAGAADCQPQPDVKDAGCDASIDHWLTPAALKIQKELPKRGIPRKVKLPEACRTLVEEEA
jgi:penicillin-insensitive murein endopeptidase